MYLKENRFGRVLETLNQTPSASVPLYPRVTLLSRSCWRRWGGMTVKWRLPVVTWFCHSPLGWSQRSPLNSDPSELLPKRRETSRLR